VDKFENWINKTIGDMESILIQMRGNGDEVLKDRLYLMNVVKDEYLRCKEEKILQADKSVLHYVMIV